jgi:hypothetical protein
MKSSFAASMVEVDAKTTCFTKNFRNLKESVASVAHHQQELVNALSSTTSSAFETLDTHTASGIAEIMKDVRTYEEELKGSVDSRVARSAEFKMEYEGELEKAEAETSEVSGKLVEGLEASLLPFREHASAWKQEVNFRSFFPNLCTIFFLPYCTFSPITDFGFEAIDIGIFLCPRAFSGIDEGCFGLVHSPPIRSDGPNTCQK